MGRRGLRRRGLTTDDVRDAGDLVDLPLDLLHGRVAILQARRDRLNLENIDRALETPLFGELVPVLDGHETAVVVLVEYAPERWDAGVVGAANFHGLDQDVDGVGE